jgi:hypothetical protein
MKVEARCTSNWAKGHKRIEPMEQSQGPGNLSCNEVRDMLSDIIDWRRGEIPHPDGTRLTEPGIRPAVELHLGACSACRDELTAMEEIGSAFAEYNVNEAPAQRFADYPKMVRARMARENLKSVQPVSRWRRVLWMSASGLAAASLAFMVMHAWQSNANKKTLAGVKKHIEVIQTPETSLASQDIILPQNVRPAVIRARVPNYSEGDEQFADREFTLGQTSETKRLQQDEGRFGYVMLDEKTPVGRNPLLGVWLKTTRETDRTVDENPGGLMVCKVEPGSTAEAMGLKQYDYIVGLNDMTLVVGSAEEVAYFFSTIHQLGTGKHVTLQVVRPKRVGTEKLYAYLKPLEGVLGQGK